MTTKNWHNALPLDEWMSLHDTYYNSKMVFKLSHYEVINGTPKFTVMVKGGREQTAGLNSMTIGELTLKLYLPIEILKPTGFKFFSPKFMFTLPSEWMISRLSDVAIAKPSAYDVVRKHRMRKVQS